MPMQESRQPLSAAGSAVLPAGDVAAIVGEWVDLTARHLPGFAGAYLWGGITALPANAPFPLYRDVHVVVVLPQGAQDDTVEILYRGLMLEVIRLDLEDHQDAQAVLSNPSHGPNMATTQILADPTGILVPLQRTVAAEYRRRRWVQARCDAERSSAEQALAGMRRATTPVERLDSLRLFLSALSGLLAIAGLKRPTTRRTLALLCELLEEQGRPDLHREALTLMGSAHMSRRDVEAMLDRFVIAFDRAVAVYQTPTPYGFAIRAHLRPYHVAGTQEMIDEGKHREAVFWITCLDEAYLVIQNDAPDAEESMFAGQLQAMHETLGLTSTGAWAARVALAERLAPEIYHSADALVTLYPE